MIPIIFKGVLFGLLLAVMLGPVFFALIQTSIVKGLKSGITMALGIAAADISYIFLMYYSVKLFKDNPTVSVLFGAFGGLIILISGIMSLVKKSFVMNAQIKTNKRRMAKQFIKGFLLNGINPFVLLYWLGVMTLVNVNYAYNKTEVIVFFCGIIGTLLITDMAKVVLAQKLRNFITESRMRIMNRVVGVALILFSIRLFFFAYEHFEMNMLSLQ